MIYNIILAADFAPLVWKFSSNAGQSPVFPRKRCVPSRFSRECPVNSPIELSSFFERVFQQREQLFLGRPLRVRHFKNGSVGQEKHPPRPN